MKTKNVANQTAIRLANLLVDIEDVPRSVVARATAYPGGSVIPPHRHRRAQLVYASEGVMTVTTEKGLWVVPPQRAVWVPALMEHHIRATGQLSMRSLYIKPDAAADLPTDCCVVAVPPLLRELILYAVTRPPLYEPDSPDERIMLVILDQIRSLPVAPLHLPIPADRRLRAIATAMTGDPGDARTLADWARTVGASSRTLARLFLAETGMSFRHWRQQVRLLEALRRLASREPVTTVALDLGYDSPSAFISMFKRALGLTPGQYFAP
jgi:AraC-like DNA-binding protein/quercetin dioxygenase-like cupin family protein